MSAAKKSPSKPRSNGRTTPKKVVTDASSWAAEGKAKAKGTALEVPSGKVCLVKRPDGMKLFLESGMVPNALLPLVQEAVNENAPKTSAEMQEMVSKDPSMLAAMLEMASNVTVDCVIEPEVFAVPLDENGREIPPRERDDDDKLYVDYIDVEDIMFIFNYAVSGVSDLAPFRH